MTPEDRSFIFRTVVCTLALIIFCMVTTLLIGLFDQRVDNVEIFKLLDPAFQTIIGCFVGLLGGLAMREQK